MQQLSSYAVLCGNAAVQGSVSVLRVSQQRVSEGRELRADLMGAPRNEMYEKQGAVLCFCKRNEGSAYGSVLRAFRNATHCGLICRAVLTQKSTDFLCLPHPSFDTGQVIFLYASLSQTGGESLQGR